MVKVIQFHFDCKCTVIIILAMTFRMIVHGSA